MDYLASTGQSVTSRIKLPEHPMDLDFHPRTELVALGLVNGALQLYRYSGCEEKQEGDGGGDEEEEDEEPLASSAGYYKAEQVASKMAHKESCRAVCFSGDGNSVFSGAADGSIRVTDPETGAKVNKIIGAHESGVSRLLAVKEGLVAAGDDDGCIKLWDPRQRHSFGEISEHDDFICDMAYQPSSHSLVAASGDMTLTINDLRKFKVTGTSQTEDCTEEPLCVDIVNNGMKIVSGTQSGKMMVSPWSKITSCNEDVKGHPDCIDTMAKYDEDTVITGCGDGMIRVVKLSPNGIVAHVGQHGRNDSVERIAFGHDLSILGSIGQDDALRLWDVGFISQLGAKPIQQVELQTEGNQSNEDDSNSEDEPKRRIRGKKERKRAKRAKLDGAPSFFSGL